MHAYRTPLVVDNVDVWRPGESVPQLVNMNFTLHSGTVTALVGPSGAGKSTLFRAILNEITVNKGSIRIDGHEVRSDRAIDPTLYSFVPQYSTLRPGLTVLQTIELAAYVRESQPMSRSARKEKVRALLEDLELIGVSDNLVTNLSGGQELRVSIALELLSEPQLLILDEPTSGLDESTAEKFIETMRTVANGKGRPAILFSTHRTADLRPGYVDNVIAIGNATDRMHGKFIPTATIRFNDRLSNLFPYFGATALAGVNEQLKGPLPYPLYIPQGKTSTAYNFVSKTLSWRRSFMYHWKIHGIGLGDWNWLVAASKTMRLGIILALALRGVSALGLAPNTAFANQSFLVYTGLLILSLVAWGSQLPVMNLVESWQVVRREQGWGVSAKAFVWSVIARQMAELVLGVITVVALALLLSDPPTENTLLPRFGASDTFLQLGLILFLAKFLAYCLGILIGCLNISPVKALGQTVGMSLLMLFGSGLLFKLPEFKPVYLSSFVLPSRAGISAVASNFRAKDAMGVVTDEAFSMNADRLYLVLLSMIGVSTITLLLSMRSINRTLRLAYSGDEPGFIARLWLKFTSYPTTAWLRSKKAAPVSVILALLLIAVPANLRDVEGESPTDTTMVQGSGTAVAAGDQPVAPDPAAPPTPPAQVPETAHSPTEAPVVPESDANDSAPTEAPAAPRPTGYVLITERLCGGQRETITNWEEECTPRSSGIGYTLISTSDSSQSLGSPSPDGTVHFTNVPEGSYRIVQDQGVWCRAVSDRYSDGTAITVSGGNTTSVTLYQCGYGSVPESLAPTDPPMTQPPTTVALPSPTPAIYPLDVTPEDDPW